MSLGFPQQWLPASFQNVFLWHSRLLCSSSKVNANGLGTVASKDYVVFFYCHGERKVSPWSKSWGPPRDKETSQRHIPKVMLILKSSFYICTTSDVSVEGKLNGNHSFLFSVIIKLIVPFPEGLRGYEKWGSWITAGRVQKQLNPNQMLITCYIWFHVMSRSTVSWHGDMHLTDLAVPLLWGSRDKATKLTGDLWCWPPEQKKFLWQRG